MAKNRLERMSSKPNWVGSILGLYNTARKIYKVRVQESSLLKKLHSSWV
jgi:hypothetical protein